jgi:hypothetical protein
MRFGTGDYTIVARGDYALTTRVRNRTYMVVDKLVTGVGSALGGLGEGYCCPLRSHRAPSGGADHFRRHGALRALS